MSKKVATNRTAASDLTDFARGGSSIPDAITAVDVRTAINLMRFLEPNVDALKDVALPRRYPQPYDDRVRDTSSS